MGDLSAKDIVKLKKKEPFILKDNQRVIGVRIAPGYMGIGGSNRSGFSENSKKVREYTLEELHNSGPLWVQGTEIYALMNDTLYFRHTSDSGEKSERTMDCQEKSCIMCGDSIAYDTISATRVSLILK